MVDVPIIKIPVDASDFEKFKALFDKYRTELKQLPGAWGETDKIVASTAEGFAGMTAALMAQAELSNKIGKNEEKSRREVERSGRAFHDMARSTKTIAGNIISATTALLKWTGVVGAVSGLVGAGGLFGIDRLALSAGASRRSSLGLGTSIGGQKAFEVNYQKYVDADSFLSNINAVAHDRAQQYGVGGDVARLSGQGKSTSDIAVELLPRMVDQFIAAGGLGGGGKTVYDYQGLSRFGSFEEFQRLAQSRGELAGSAAGYARDRNTLGLAPDIARQWQDFSIQMARAGQQIETVFIKGLAPLEPNLSRLSSAFADFISNVLDPKKHPEIGRWIDDIASGLGKFAQFIGTPQFESDVKAFADGVESLAKGLVSAMRWLGLIPDGGAPAAGGGPVLRVPGVGELNRTKDPRSLTNPFGSPAAAIMPEGIDRSRLLAAVAWTESRGNANAVSTKGARGAFQFMPETARQYGLSDPFDPAASERAAGRYLDDLSREFHGDIEKMLGAYNWGSGNVEKDIAKYGAGWKDHLPAETSDYIRKIVGALNGGSRQRGATAPGARLTIQNQTGGSAVIIGNQVAV